MYEVERCLAAVRRSGELGVGNKLLDRRLVGLRAEGVAASLDIALAGTRTAVTLTRCLRVSPPLRGEFLYIRSSYSEPVPANGART
jgi:hypothetical protein